MHSLRSLIFDPCLILTDEPTGGLDPKSRDIIMNLLRYAHIKGRGIILIPHDVEVTRSADTFYFLEGGKLKSQAP